MRRSKWIGIFSGSALATISLSVIAADKNPVAKKITDEVIMERVLLVGVIAGGKSKESGIAVIKDAQSGKTYAIRTGDSLPGVNHIQFHSVMREVAVFIADGKKYMVRLNIGATEDKSRLNSNDETAQEESFGPGLFEKWYGSRIGVGSDLISERSNASVSGKSSVESAQIEAITIGNPKEQAGKAKEDTVVSDAGGKLKAPSDYSSGDYKSIRDHAVIEDHQIPRFQYQVDEIEEFSE